MAKKKTTGVDEDGIPFMTDKMKEALDKGKDLPIEQLVSPQGLAQIEAMAGRRKAPVRADTLRPISHTQAKQMVTGNPEGRLVPGEMPRMPATRRIIPAPFQRPRIAVSSAGGHGKSWQTVAAAEITREDIITDIGRVIEVKCTIRRETIAGVTGVAAGEDVIVVGAGGAVAVFDARDEVPVFRV